MPKADLSHATPTVVAQHVPLSEQISQLRRHQSPDSAPQIGERFAAAILATTAGELAAFAETLEDGDCGDDNTLVALLGAAEDSLMRRHDRVRAATARLAIAANTTAKISRN